MDPLRTDRRLWATFAVSLLTVFLGIWVVAVPARGVFYHSATDVLALTLLAAGFGWLLQMAVALFWWWLARGPGTAEAADYRDGPSPELPDGEY